MQACRKDTSGDDETINIAIAVTNDFDLAEDDAFEAMRDWNKRCDPSWPEHLLRKKLLQKRQPRKHLLKKLLRKRKNNSKLFEYTQAK